MGFIKQYKTQFFILLPLFALIMGSVWYFNERNKEVLGSTIATTTVFSSDSSLNNGLLVYATFDRGFELTNFASSTNPFKQNDGRATNGIGIQGQSFDQTTLGMGTFSKISTAYLYTSNTLPMYSTIADDFEVTFAAKNGNANSIGRVISARPSATPVQNWEIYQTAANRLYVQMFDSEGIKTAYCSTKPTWTFFTLKKSGNTVTLSQNLTSCGTVTLTNTVSTTPAKLWIGGIAWGNGQYDGKIDEVRVYNRALTSAEETLLYNQVMKGQINAQTVTGRGKQYTTSTMILWTTFDTYPNTTTVVDSSGNGHNGTISTPAAASLYASSSAPNGNTELNFPRNNDNNTTLRNRYVDFGDLPEFNFVTTSNWSCSAWVRIDLKNWIWGAGGNDIPVLVGKKAYVNTSSTGWQWTLDNRNLKGVQAIRFNNGTIANDSVISGSALPFDFRNQINDGKYHHYGFTVSSVGKTTANARNVWFYFDGKPTYTAPFTVGGTTASDNLTNTSSFVFGKNSVANSSYMKYEMDDVRCWNTELTPKDFYDIYTFNKDNFIDNTYLQYSTGTLFHASFSNPNPLLTSSSTLPLTTEGTVKYTIGLSGQGGKGYGIGNWTTSASTLLNGATNFTVLGCLKIGATQVNATAAIVNFPSGFLIDYTASSQSLGLWYYQSDATLRSIGSLTPTFGKWGCFAFVKNGATGSNYWNGNLKTAGVTAGDGTQANPSSALLIGGRNGTSYDFVGEIDEIEVRNYAMTQAEIQSWYNFYK